MHSCVYSQRPCVVRGAIFPSAGGLADCEGCADGGHRKPEDWAGAAVLREALGPESLVRPLVPLRITDNTLDVAVENAAERTQQSRSNTETPVSTFSQHQNENVEMSVMEFGRRLTAGQRLQLRLTLAEWQAQNASSGVNLI